MRGALGIRNVLFTMLLASYIVYELEDVWNHAVGNFLCPIIPITEPLPQHLIFPQRSCCEYPKETRHPPHH